MLQWLNFNFSKSKKVGVALYYIFPGGCNPASETPKQPLKKVHRMSTMIRRWVTVADMLDARMNHCACVFNEKIYVFGGIGEKDRFILKLSKAIINHETNA